MLIMQLVVNGIMAIGLNNLINSKVLESSEAIYHHATVPEKCQIIMK